MLSLGKPTMEDPMSLQPKEIAPVPDETARVARAAFPKGNAWLSLRDELGTIYRDEMFAGLSADAAGLGPAILPVGGRHPLAHRCGRRAAVGPVHRVALRSRGAFRQKAQHLLGRLQGASHGKL
jgi:hypothetical protein